MSEILHHGHAQQKKPKKTTVRISGADIDISGAVIDCLPVMGAINTRELTEYLVPRILAGDQIAVHCIPDPYLQALRREIKAHGMTLSAKPSVDGDFSLSAFTRGVRILKLKEEEESKVLVSVAELEELRALKASLNRGE